MKAFIVPVCAFLLGMTAAPALAQTAMSDAQIKQKLEAAGYTNVRIGKHEKDHIDVKADKAGKTQKLAVDIITGAAKPETDDDD